MGALIWANAALFGTNRGLYVLYVAQFTLGLGTGSLGVTRSYVVEQSTPAKRTYMLAYLTALQYGGFTVTPLLGSLLVVTGGSISEYCKYALPAYFVFFLSLVCTALLYYPFEGKQLHSSNHIHKL